MKKSRIRKTILSGTRRDLPEDLQSEIESDPELRELRDRTMFVRRVVALKRYETPAPGSRERCVVMFRKRIEWLEERESAKSSELESVGWPALGLRYGLAAVVVAVLVIHTFTSGSRQPSSTQMNASILGPIAPDKQPNREFQFIPIPPGPNFQDEEMAPLFDFFVTNPQNFDPQISRMNPTMKAVGFEQ